MKNVSYLIGAGLLLLTNIAVPYQAKATEYSTELQEAYEWAYENGIISESSIDNAGLYDSLTNLELAEIMNNFAENVLHQTPDTDKSCTFTDTSSLTESQKAIITKVCQLGLMPGDKSSTNFEPNEDTNRGIFGSALSRALWGDQYEKGDPYYVTHLNVLKTAGIMNNIEHPDAVELKGYVLSVLMKVVENGNINEVKIYTFTLKPGLNTFSTPAILKSISFSNGGKDMWFAKMEKGQWTGLKIGEKAFVELIQPLEGYLIKNNGTEDIIMTVEYDTDNSNSLMFSKNLDAGWNFLGVTTTTNPFNVIADATAALILDLTNGQNTNLIQLGKTFLNATKYVLGKAYAVFVNNSGTYGGINNYGDDNDEQFKSCWTNPDILCKLDDQGHLLTPETCPSYCLREELINNISESVEYTKGESSEREVFNGYFKSKKGTIGIDKINVSCGNEEGFCFSNMIFYLNIGQSNYIINNQGSLTLNNISVEENKSIPISIYAYTNNSNFERVGKHVYYLRLNLSNGDERLVRLVPMYVKNPGGQTYENRLVYSYERAYENGIISEGNIDDANLYKALTNLELAEIMNNYAENVLHQTPDPSKSCTFTDVTSLTESQKAIITKVCQLGLMPGDKSSATFEPNEDTNRGIFATALSRALWGDRYEGGEPYYGNHYNALLGAGIMNLVDNPENTPEIKGYVLAMLMHALDDTGASDTGQSVQTGRVALTNNITGTVEFKSNEIVKKTVFDGTYTALNNEGRHINTIEFEGNYCYDNCPLSGKIEFCLEIRGEEYCTMSKDVNKGYNYIKLSEKIDLNLNEPEHIVVTAEYAGNYGTGIFDIEMLISDDYGFYGYHRVDLAPIKIVDGNAVTIQRFPENDVPLLKAKNSELASFRIKPVNNNEVYLSTIGLRTWGAFSCDDIELTVDGTKYECSNSGSDLSYEIDETIGVKSGNVVISLEDEYEGDVLIGITEINGQYNYEDGYPIPWETFAKRFDVALAYIDSQTNAGDETEYTLLVDTYDGDGVEYTVSNLKLYTGYDSEYGQCVGELSISGLGNVELEDGDAVDFRINNGASAQMIKCIKYEHNYQCGEQVTCGGDIIIDKDNYPDYFKTRSGESRKVFAKNGNIHCLGMNMSQVNHVVNGNTITLRWTAVDGDSVSIALFNPDTQMYDNLGTVDMDEEEFDYEKQWSGEHNFRISNGCSEITYKVDA